MHRSTHRPRRQRWALALSGILLLSACGGADDGSDPAVGGLDATQGTDPQDAGTTDAADDTAAGGDTGDDTAAGDPDTGAATLATASTDLGTILVDGEGWTLYVFDNDTDGTSACYDSCAEAWPPLTGEVTASGDVDPDLIGSTERTDGTVQVTYDGMPLYYYAADSAPGDTNGQGVGDVWWVIGPDGTAIEATSSAGGGVDY